MMTPLTTLEGILGGVYFPIAVMPASLQIVSKFLPITYAIRSMELAVYRGHTLFQLKREVLFLVLFSAILLPLSLAAFRYALYRTKKQGSLSHY